MLANYRNRNLDNFFLDELTSEGRRLLTYPPSMRITQDVSENYGASMTVGFGDLFNRLKDGGMGHVKEYLEFRKKLGRMGKGVPENTYRQKTEQVRSLFSKRAHRDIDVGFVFPKIFV